METLRIQQKMFGFVGPSLLDTLCTKTIPFGLGLERSIRGFEFLRASTKTSRLRVNADFELFARQSQTFALLDHPHDLDPVTKKLLQGLGLLPIEDWFTESRLYKSNDGSLFCSLCNEEYFGFMQPVKTDRLEFSLEADSLIHQISKVFPFAYDGELGFITSKFLLDANRPHLLSFTLQEKDHDIAGYQRAKNPQKLICSLSSKYDLKLIRQYQGDEGFAEGGTLFVHYNQAGSQGAPSDLDKYFAYLYYANEITTSEGDEVFNKIGQAFENGARGNGALMLRLVLTRFLEHICQETNEDSISDKLRADLYREAIRDVLYLTKRGIHV